MRCHKFKILNFALSVCSKKELCRGGKEDPAVPSLPKEPRPKGWSLLIFIRLFLQSLIHVDCRTAVNLTSWVCTWKKNYVEHFAFRFLPALLTAVLTNHLAWVPTVMPNGQPPIRIFLEKHSSQSVDMLAKTHPYNPLWAQLGMWQTSLNHPTALHQWICVQWFLWMLVASPPSWILFFFFLFKTRQKCVFSSLEVVTVFICAVIS